MISFERVNHIMDSSRKMRVFDASGVGQAKQREGIMNRIIMDSSRKMRVFDASGVGQAKQREGIISSPSSSSHNNKNKNDETNKPLPTTHPLHGTWALSNPTLIVLNAMTKITKLANRKK